MHVRGKSTRPDGTQKCAFTDAPLLKLLDALICGQTTPAGWLAPKKTRDYVQGLSDGASSVPSQIAGHIEIC